MKLKLNKIKINQRIIISSLVLALVIIGGYFVGTMVGKAVETPSPLPVNLDGLGIESINVNSVETVKIILKPSGSEDPLNYLIRLTPPDEKEMVSYSIHGGEGVNVDELEGEADLLQSVLAKGLLNLAPHQNSGPIYLDGDDDADIQLNLENNYLSMMNLNYQPPAPAQFNLFDENMNPLALDFMFDNVNQIKPYFINVSSDLIAPILSATVDGVPLSAAEFSINVTGENFVTAKLDWTINESDAYVLEITASVGGESTSKQYIIAINSVIYNLDEPKFPHTYIKRTDEEVFQVHYRFRETTELQPFSLPCRLEGVQNVEDIIDDDEIIDKIITYDPEQEVQQWTPGIEPDDFDTMDVNEGYLLKLSEPGIVEMTVICEEAQVPPSVPSLLYSIPDLKSGWNLVSVGGYENVPLADLNSKIPPFKSIQSVTLLKQGLESQEGIQELVPGKVYWVHIQ